MPKINEPNKNKIDLNVANKLFNNYKLELKKKNSYINKVQKIVIINSENIDTEDSDQDEFITPAKAARLSLTNKIQLAAK